MGKWINEFLAESKELGADKPDIVPSVSCLSVPVRHVSPENRPGSDINAAPLPPLKTGWFVTYTDRQGRLCGGWEDRQCATVMACAWTARGWAVHLSSGQAIPLAAVRCVGQIDEQGALKAAWSVHAHGYGGGTRSGL